MLLKAAMRQNPVPTIIGKKGAFSYTDSDPSEFSVPADAVCKSLAGCMNGVQLVKPPVLTGNIPAGPLVLALPATTVAYLIGIKWTISAGDNVGLASTTFVTTLIDDKGQSFDNEMVLSPMRRQFDVLQLFATRQGNIAVPFIMKQGVPALTAPAPTAVDRVTSTSITGPQGLEITAEYVNAKHPEVIAYFRSLRQGLRDSDYNVPSEHYQTDKD